MTKTSEFGIHVWGESLDMKKAFDRVEHRTIFAALRHFGVDEDYIALIHMVYDGQIDTMDGIHFFDITRGVR